MLNIDIDECPVCHSRDIEAKDNGKSFKIICKSCGRIVEAIDTTSQSSKESRKNSASIAWNYKKRY